MTTVKLGTRPKAFKPFPVDFEMPDGTPGSIEVVYKYRTRSEYAGLMNQMFTDAGVAAPDDVTTDVGVDFKKLYDKASDKNADHLLSSIESWNLDEPLTRASLAQLGDEIPAAAVALMACYRDACIEGRLGNSRRPQ